MRQEVARRDADRAVSRVARRQHGAVTFSQLLEAGLKPNAVSRRVQAGRLHRVHRGIYAVGHAGLAKEGRWVAAVLACGPGAVLSHQAAGALWAIAPLPSRIDVTVSGDSGRMRRAGIRLHRSSTLLPSHRVVRRGIPVTTPARTLADLRRVLPGEEFAEAVRRAEFQRLPIGDRFEVDHTRSELEKSFLSVCRRHQLARPEVNVRVGKFLVDFLWRDSSLIVEVDGWHSHSTRSAFESDRARDAQLKLLGYDVVRFTWRAVTEDAEATAGTVRTLLAGSRYRLGGGSRGARRA
jgi:very-short-patch-repair endonuclease